MHFSLFVIITTESLSRVKRSTKDVLGLGVTSSSSSDTRERWGEYFLPRAPISASISSPQSVGTPGSLGSDISCQSTRSPDDTDPKAFSEKARMQEVSSGPSRYEETQIDLASNTGSNEILPQKRNPTTGRRRPPKTRSRSERTQSALSVRSRDQLHVLQEDPDEH